MDTEEPPVPSLPDSLSKSTPVKTRPRRTSSLPPKSGTPTTPRKSTQAPQPASPEVITSLIDSLSAISAPAHNYFESLPDISGSRSTPASPFAAPTEFTEFIDRQRDHDFLHPDDAADFPIIRTSKPPSGRSSITAPKQAKKRDSGSFKGYLRGNNASSTSLNSFYSTHSTHDRDDTNSIGNVSIEAGVGRRTSEQNARKSSSESKRSTRAKSLFYINSRERLKKETRSASVAASAVDSTVVAAAADFVALMSEGENAENAPGFLAETAIIEEPVVGMRATTRRKRKPPPMNLALANSNLSPDSPGTPGGAIPQRQSSLRHSSVSPGRGRRKSRNLDGTQPMTPVVPEFEPDAKAEDNAVEEESSALKRIEELKRKKYLRNSGSSSVMTLQSPASQDASAPNMRSPTTSPVLPKSYSTPSVSERRHSGFDSTARMKSGVLTPDSQSNQSAQHDDIRQTTLRAPAKAKSGELNHAPLTPMTPMGPLPINYNHVVQSLGDTPSSPTSISGTPKASNSRSAVGGRSAPSRNTATSVILEGHESETSTPRGTMSSEIDSGQRSKSFFLSPSNSMTSNSGRKQKSKRWSNPENAPKGGVPVLRSQKKGQSPAVQPLAHQIREDRPASADSIEVTIEEFVNAPRLSQQCQHPNGRIIAFSEVGDPHGFAVFCCVGMGLTRYVMSFYDELAKTLKLRLITPDRPGIGGSESDPNVTPLTWTDDILTICQALRIPKFSILAHSAGAVYALATALRMPQHIRGKVHLLAPWIPPSQMAPIGALQSSAPGGQLPRAQRFLRTLPPSILKIANASFLSTTSASITRSMPKSPKGQRRKTSGIGYSPTPTRPEAVANMDQIAVNSSALSLAPHIPTMNNLDTVEIQKMKNQAEQERREIIDERLTLAIWEKATTNANPATDLIVCLETRYPIGFRYEDITRGVVIHHGSKDSRVPVENVRWLGRIMRRCEVRILEGESHGLMANPIVMGNLLMEIAKEWEDWTAAVDNSSRPTRKASRTFLHPSP